MDVSDPYFAWEFIAVVFWLVILVNLTVLKKWYLGLVTIAITAVPASFIAAFFLDSVKHTGMFKIAESRAQSWEILVVTTAVFLVLILASIGFLLTFVAKNYNAGKGSDHRSAGP